MRLLQADVSPLSLVDRDDRQACARLVVAERQQWTAIGLYARLWLSSLGT